MELLSILFEIGVGQGLAGLGAGAAAGKIRVGAVMCDISGINETDRNTDSQLDSAV